MVSMYLFTIIFLCISWQKLEKAARFLTQLFRRFKMSRKIFTSLPFRSFVTKQTKTWNIFSNFVSKENSRPLSKTQRIWNIYGIVLCPYDFTRYFIFGVFAFLFLYHPATTTNYQKPNVCWSFLSLFQFEKRRDRNMTTIKNFGWHLVLGY